MRVFPVAPLILILPLLAACPREAPARRVDCDPGHAPCPADTAFGPVTLRMTPRPIPAMKPFEVEIVAQDPLDHVAIDFNGRDMDMGPNTVQLAAMTGGRWLGSATIPVCVTGRMRWQATLTLDRNGRSETLRFEFDTAPP